ncbi:hypothetical protein [Hellea balneolensis]|uniref:hypothetical protein n=1 Tax=Hellea balneolensis TaxID=287478 RepID=UPI000417EE22|nr:hypothetical protein [Hellea balneolensis]
MTSAILDRPQGTAFPAITKIIEAIKAQPMRDHALGDIAADYIVKSMAEENGFANLLTPEERAFATMLRRLAVGPRAAHYGWRLYAKYRQSGDIALESVNY